jgi:hypothetical protein
MKSPINIALDTETWGKRAGCDARSIGGIVFNPHTQFVADDDRSDLDGEHGYAFHVALHNPLQGLFSPTHYTQIDLDSMNSPRRWPGLWRDPDTVKWWHAQPQEAQAAFENPVDLKEGLIAFSEWMRSLGVDPENENSCRVWGHGRAYDPPIIEAWFHVVGLPVPWHYRAPRDSRTIFDAAAVGDHSAWMKKHRHGVLHNSLDDSITLATAVGQAYKRLPY